MDPSRTTAQQDNENLVIPQHFTYEFFEENRYTISEKGNYEALCNNGFIKLYTKLCRVYWHTQNQFGHEVPDWKFHVSVKEKDIKKAWNLIVALFIKMNCRAGLKVNYIREAQNPQPGREITIYLIKYDPSFEKSQFAGDFGLDISVEHSEDYWLTLCKKIEETLDSYEIEPNGLADGDFKLGKYISLRNEAYIRNEKGEGWNPLKFQLPINLEKFKNLDSKTDDASSQSPQRGYIYGILFFASITLAFFRYRSK